MRGSINLQISCCAITSSLHTHYYINLHGVSVSGCSYCVEALTSGNNVKFSCSSMHIREAYSEMAVAPTLARFNTACECVCGGARMCIDFCLQHCDSSGRMEVTRHLIFHELLSLRLAGYITDANTGHLQGRLLHVIAVTQLYLLLCEFKPAYIILRYYDIMYYSVSPFIFQLLHAYIVLRV